MASETCSAVMVSALAQVGDGAGHAQQAIVRTRPEAGTENTRREGGKANATIDRELEPLRRAPRLAHVRQLLPSIPKMRVLTENNSRQGFLERPDLEAVVLRAWTSATDRRTDLQVLSRS